MTDALDDATECLARFHLGVHHIRILQHSDGALSLWLDGCLRKRRGSHGSPAYLWTNVELPFEDHHLIEIRREYGDDGNLSIHCNGRPVTLDGQAPMMPASTTPVTCKQGDCP